MSAQLLGDVVFLSVDNIEVEISSGIRANLKATLNDVATRLQDSHVGSWDRRNHGVEGIIIVLKWDADPNIRIVAVGNLCKCESRPKLASDTRTRLSSINLRTRDVDIAHTVDAHKVMSDRLAHENPEKVVAVLRLDGIITAE